MTIALIPESAPFTPEQRAWLNGFLAGWIGVGPADDGEASLPALLNGSGSLAPASQPEAVEVFPWHDPNLALTERLTLAEGKPLNRRLMSAMAQLDCGACGYLCQTYSEAIASGQEKNLTLCSPGGKETAKTIKLLLKETPAGPAASAVNGHVNGAAASIAGESTGYDRKNPYPARVKSLRNLNGPGSSKTTTHVELELGESGLTYEVGDSLGVYPTNCPELVDQIMGRLVAADPSLRQRLIERTNLREVSDSLLEMLIASATDPAQKAAVEALVDSDELDTLDVLDVLNLAPSMQLTGEALLELLTEMAPRLYSIASSLHAHPGEVHLTVGRASVRIRDREYQGVASTLFADRVAPGDVVRVFVHKSHGFTVPADPSVPMIMVGPGTGIAPFRAFLEERQAVGGKGPNWLFFGDQHAACDFLYQDQLEEMLASGLLTRMSTAFSRDQDEKVYVQDRMREEAAVLFEWLEGGAHFYVCGDAKRMAGDVDKALREIIANRSGQGAEFAERYLQRIKSEGRYQRDVY